MPQVCTSISKRLHDEITQYANHHDQSVSRVMAEMIEEGMARRRGKDPHGSLTAEKQENYFMQTIEMLQDIYKMVFDAGKIDNAYQSAEEGLKIIQQVTKKYLEKNYAD